MDNLFVVTSACKMGSPTQVPPLSAYLWIGFKVLPPLMENHMEKKMESEMETGELLTFG